MDTAVARSDTGTAGREAKCFAAGGESDGIRHRVAVGAEKENAMRHLVQIRNPIADLYKLCYDDFVTFPADGAFP